jgi:hypothetical protein
LNLADHVDAVGVLVQHTLDSAQVAFGNFQALYYILSMFRHNLSLSDGPTPLGGVVVLLYNLYRIRQEGKIRKILENEESSVMRNELAHNQPRSR